MKKLLAIFVILAMVVGVTFADVSFGGSTSLGFKIQGDSKASTVGFEQKAAGYGTSATWASEDGTAGAKIKLGGDVGVRNKWEADYTDNPLVNNLNGRIWWKPIQYFKLDIFRMQDEGVMGRGNIIGWGYQSNSAAGNVSALYSNNWNGFSGDIIGSGVGFFGGSTNGTVLALSLYPIDGLTINYANQVKGPDTVKKWLATSLFQVSYEYSGVGSFTASFDNNGADGDKGSRNLAFDLGVSALDGMAIELGVSFDVEKDKKNPLSIGLGYGLNQWSGDAFKFFARVGAVIAEKDTKIGLDLNPSIQIGDVGRVYVDVGFAIDLPDGGNTGFYWHATPYLSKSLGIGNLLAGFSMWGAPSDTKFTWAIPVFFEASF